ncbi:MAG: rRNA pseudouridine synthase [Planctomycetes bacterium]|nr:rRNA pseudouridine synthase [Planctomycetota bacterium]MBI3846918.1 rRNA pseudouridine synthase [Planctomycetota bacterium]
MKTEPLETAPRERLQKVLARAGVASRRHSEELIAEGRVQVNGRVVRELGFTVDPASARIFVDGEAIRPERRVYVLLYKPRGVVCTNFSGETKPRAIDVVAGVRERLFTVGRLDEHSDGLVILTNDGAFANRIAHPRYEVPKTYLARVAGPISDQELARMLKGVWLAEGKTVAESVEVVKRGRDETMVRITLCEGRNREIRRVLAKLGHKVTRLRRIRIGSLTLRGLSAGQWRYLAKPEVSALLHAREIAARPRRPRAAHGRKS